jgi:cytoskeletal protein RodZ
MSDSLDQFWKVIDKTKPPKLDDLSLEEIKRYEHYLSTKLPSLIDGRLVTVCRNRIDLLRQEIQSQRIEEKADKRHQESSRIGTKTLFWARWAVVAAVVVPVVLALISQFPISKLLHAKTDKASPPTSRQTPAPTAASQESEASSNTATPSPEQTTTAQPSPTMPP